MKKLIVLLALAFFVTTTLAFSNDSPYYAKSVFISKVVSHQKGYRITYVTNKEDLVNVYLPVQFFYKEKPYVTDDGFVKCELVYGRGPQFPYMTIYWKDGKFHHIRLFLNADYNDSSWGVLRDGDNLDAKFDPSKDPEFTFSK